MSSSSSSSPILDIRSSGKELDRLNKIMSDPKNHVFVFFFMHGCGPCNNTHPQWDTFVKNNTPPPPNVFLVRIDQSLSNQIKHVKDAPSSFPTLRCYHKGTYTTYENCSTIKNKDRSAESFQQWLNHSNPPPIRTFSHPHHSHHGGGGSRTSGRRRKRSRSRRSRRSRKDIRT